MNLDYTLSRFGLAEAPPNWLFCTNCQSHVSRVYYVLEEGAGCMHEGRRYWFRKNHLYVLPQSLALHYFLERRSFLHLFVDFSAASCLCYDRVLCVDPSQYPVLQNTIDSFLYYLRAKHIRFLDKFSSPLEFHAEKDRVGFIISALFYDIMEIFPAPPPNSQAIANSVGYIHRHYRRPISVAQLAKEANLSESYYSKLFIQATGSTPYQYVRNYRFDMAIEMLLSGASVTETAERCGFLSVAAFSNSFRKRFGYPPNQCKELPTEP